MVPIEQTIREFLGGDREAFTQLVRQWEVKIYNLAWRFLGNREDAQDVVQDTFLSVYRSLRSLKDPGSFSTWIYRIALNHCRARWRARVPEDPLDAAGGPSGALAVPAATAEQDPVEVRDLIRKALADLSEDHRAAIILKEYVGLSLEELARVMDCPLSTAKSRLYHGLREVQHKLHRLLGPP